MAVIWIGSPVLPIASLVISVIMLSIGRDQEVDAEDGADAGEGRGHARQRMAADADERRRAERDQDEVAGVGGDARQHADEDRG